MVTNGILHSLMFRLRLLFVFFCFIRLFLTWFTPDLFFQHLSFSLHSNVIVVVSSCPSLFYQTCTFSSTADIRKHTSDDNPDKITLEKAIESLKEVMTWVGLTFPWESVARTQTRPRCCWDAHQCWKSQSSSKLCNQVRYCFYCCLPCYLWIEYFLKHHKDCG